MQFDPKKHLALAAILFGAITFNNVTLQAAPPVSKSVTKPAPKSATSQAVLSLTGWEYEFDGDELEDSWSWTAQIAPSATTWEARVPFHYRNAQNYALLQLKGAGKDLSLAFWLVANGKTMTWGETPTTLSGANQAGQLTIQRSAWQVRALWNGRTVLSAFGPPSGGEIGIATRGAKVSGERLQPTEPVAAQDDFMRAEGPMGDGVPQDEAARKVVVGKPVMLTTPPDPPKSGEWRPLRGSWKTSMMLDSRIRFDSSLNPNPFVYRAESKGAAITSIGKWFWNDYSVAVAFKPMLKSTGAPLVAGVAAYAQANGQAVVGEVDLRSGRAVLKQGNQVLAQSERFACAPNQWHRLFLEPGPGTIRLLVDGIERVRATPKSLKSWHEQPLAQGEAQLRAELGEGNYIDFDDVNIAANYPLNDDFKSATAYRWKNGNGNWQVSNGALTKTNNGVGLGITGAIQHDGLLEAGFARERAGKNSGLAFAIRDAKNYFLARQTMTALELVEIADGKERLLAQTKFPGVSGQPFGAHPLTVEWQNGAIKARLGFANAAQFTATATVNEIPEGRVGVWADGAPGAVATSFRVLSAAPGWGEPPLPARFQKDRLMRHWASNAGAWKRVNPDPDFSHVYFYVPEEARKKNPEQIWMHTGDFFRDAEVSVPLPDMAPGAKMTLHLRENFEGVPIVLPPHLKMIFRPGRGPETLAGNQNITNNAAKPDKITMKVQALQPGGAHLEVERVGNEWQWKLFEGDKLIKTATAPYQKPVPDKKSYVSAGAVRFVRRPIGGGQVALKVTLDGKVLLETIAPESAAGSKVLIRLLNIQSGSQPEEEAILPPSHFWFEKAQADTLARLDYTFTGAPVDWFAGRGRWEVAERWTCQPQWSFFRGFDDVDPTLWSRFAPQGDFTLEAYLATPMDQTRGEKSPVDLNVTVGADGRNLSSGYSFIFAPKTTAPHYILRGDQLALKTGAVMPQTFGGQHQDWYYVRIERRQTPEGLRFRWTVNNQEIADYLDDKPLGNAAGRIAFWSHNFDLSIARVRLWHDGLENTPEEGAAPIDDTPIKNALDVWTPRRDGLLETTAQIEAVSPGETLKVTNPKSGGDWTVYVSRKPIDVNKRPVLQFSYRLPQGVFLNLYAKIGGRWREIAFNGDNTFGGLTKNEVPPDTSIRLGQIENVRADNQWHEARFDLKKALLYNGLTELQIEALAFAAPERGYLRAGLGGNHQGATYWIRDFQMPLTSTNTATVAALKQP
ncbi:MAG TPA: hypothetical protein VGB77_20850 [Abditibacteriaceae bacterium]|jgi:hypothetical protein